MTLEQVYLTGSIGGLLFSPIVAFAVSWGVAKTRINGMRAAVDQLYVWKDMQSNACASHMINYEREHERLKGIATSNSNLIDEKFKEIIRRLEKIETIVDRRRED